jgi:hypothetical protein
MADTVAPAFERFIANERVAKRLAAPPAPQALAEGELWHPVSVDAQRATELLQVAALRASGIFHATKRTEVVWVEGDREIAIGIADLRVALGDGLLRVLIPVRSDQTGATHVEVAFAVGSAKAPAGLFASTLQQPSGPAVIVSAWGDALVAFAWQCLLGLVTGLAGAVGKDARGNVLVPVDLVASTRTLQVLPMARHRFSGASGLRTAITATTTATSVPR